MNMCGTCEGNDGGMAINTAYERGDGNGTGGGGARRWIGQEDECHEVMKTGRGNLIKCWLLDVCMVSVMSSLDRCSASLHLSMRHIVMM